MKHFLLFLALGLLLVVDSHAQRKLRTLFIGNSYTYVNNLPDAVARVATSLGDTLEYDVSAVGGYTFQDHCGYAATLTKIRQGRWDYVVLQEQSQLPSFNDGQVNRQVVPYAKRLDSLIHVAQPQARTFFYITWGRKDGDAGNCAVWPPVCTYRGMDSVLRVNYERLANLTGAALSPVGPTRRRLRRLAPGIELYQTDGSHPSVAGTYAAACTFYAVLFRKDPTTATYLAGLPATDAAQIKAAAKTVAFDSLTYWRVLTPTASPTPLEATLTASPNPANGEVALSGLPAGVASITLYNAAGKRVLAASPRGAEARLDVSTLSPGLYLVEALAQGRRQTIRLIISAR